MPIIMTTPFTIQVVPGTNITSFNPLDKDTEVTLSNGNNTAAIPSGPVVTNVRTVLGLDSGKWYIELELNTLGNQNDLWFGLSDSGDELISQKAFRHNGLMFRGNGNEVFDNSGSTGINLGFSYAQGDIVQFAVDFDIDNIWVGKNGTYAVTAPWSGYPGAVVAGSPAGLFHFMYGTDDNGSGAMQATLVTGGFTHSPPVGF